VRDAMVIAGAVPAVAALVIALILARSRRLALSFRRGRFLRIIRS